MSSKFPYPNNPHVSNESINADNPDHIVFKDSLVGWIEIILGTSIPLLGIMCACLVAYLSIHHTPMYIRPFAKIIQLFSAVDIVYSLFDLITQPRVQSSSNGVMYSLAGPVAYMPYQFQCYIFSTRRSVQFFGFLTTPIAYAFRYQILKRNTTSPFSYIIAYFVVSSILGVVGFVTNKITYCDFENPDAVDYGALWYVEVPIPALFISTRNSLPTIIYNWINPGCVGFSYLISIVFGIMTIQELKRQNLTKNDRIFTLEKEVGRVLMAQSLVPLISFVLPTLLPRFMPAFNISPNYYHLDFILKMITLFPLLNSLSVVLFVVPYRRFCRKALKSMSLTGNTNNSVIEIATINTSSPIAVAVVVIA